MLSRNLVVTASGRPPAAAVRIAVRGVPARRAAVLSVGSGREHGPSEAPGGSAAEDISGALEENWEADLNDDSTDWAGGEEDEDPGGEEDEGEAGGWGRPVEDLDDDVPDGRPPVRSPAAAASCSVQPSPVQLSPAHLRPPPAARRFSS